MDRNRLRVDDVDGHAGTDVTDESGGGIDLHRRADDDEDVGSLGFGDGILKTNHTMNGRSCEPSAALSPRRMTGLAGSMSQMHDGSFGLRLEVAFISSPCRWMTCELPARSCRLSTFCVTTVTSKCCSNAATIR